MTQEHIEKVVRRIMGLPKDKENEIDNVFVEDGIEIYQRAIREFEYLFGHELFGHGRKLTEDAFEPEDYKDYDEAIKLINSKISFKI
jgi:hypothetical protein